MGLAIGIPITGKDQPPQLVVVLTDEQPRNQPPPESVPKSGTSIFNL